MRTLMYLDVPYHVPYLNEVRTLIMNIYPLTRHYAQDSVPTYLTYLYPGVVSFSVVAGGESTGIGRGDNDISISCP